MPKIIRKYIPKRVKRYFIRRKTKRILNYTGDKMLGGALGAVGGAIVGAIGVQRYLKRQASQYSNKPKKRRRKK